jgi:O-antigen/teichoic acid export membrane protein
MRTRLVQLLVMIAGLFALGPSMGITGVALAVDLMLVVGIILLLWQARAYVDYSPRRMFLVPVLALALALVSAQAVLNIMELGESLWLTGAVKGAVFSLTYAALILLLEWNQLPMLWGIVKEILPKRRNVEME